MVNDIGEMRKIARAYSKNKTFVFVEEFINGKVSYYNGYITDVKTDMLIFLDSILDREFPILLEYIKLIKPSRKKEDGN